MLHLTSYDGISISVTANLLQILKVTTIIVQFLIASLAGNLPVKEDDRFDFKISNVKSG